MADSENTDQNAAHRTGPDENGTVTATVDGHLCHIVVDRSDKMNGFTPEMFEQLGLHLQELDQNPELWVGVISFAGANTTAGLDLPRFAGSMRGESTEGSAAERPGIDPFGMRSRCSKPVVMAVQGITFTIGIEMMLSADIVIAADDCRFAQLEPKRGLAVFGGAHVRYVERAGWGNAMYHLLRADEFNAARALELGFVQDVVPAGAQVDRAVEVAGEILACAPLAVQEIKRAARVFATDGEAAAFAEIDTMRARTAGSEDFSEGLNSFIERRPANFTGR
ncbi:MAG: crotonase/enoyl-CoA hydratase family protein [Actinomycetota bacterium]